ncbi:hypothetical protein CDL15_Pgr024329 [Punica granatum]|nr:hypothetical protein CDL15_Pgr024329 [Punica granatum]PKI55996.1 hypothetical protein CRG98_023624 [Punica granatum]
MAATASSDATDGPVLSLINKRIRTLRKKHNRILQMEESLAQGKSLNKEQEEVLRSKPYVVASMDELEKLRPQLSVALQEELNLAVQRYQVSPSPEESAPAPSEDSDLKDLLNLLYFGALFDVKSQSDFTATMLTRTHERGCCLTYDYVTDDATDLLGEKDLDTISSLGNLLISRPVDTSLSHKNALERCLEHAKLWLARSDQAIEPNSGITYAELRERLNKIMVSDYFTATPEMKAPVDVAAAGNYAPFQVQVNGSSLQVTEVPVQEQGSSDAEHEQKGEDERVNQEQDAPVQASPVEEAPECQAGDGDTSEAPPAQAEGEIDQQAEEEFNQQKDSDVKEQQFHPRRSYQNHRGGRLGGGGGGRRGYYGGRGGRGGGGGYQNGRHQYYDQPGNYYPRGYYNNRGRGGRGGSGHPYNNHHHHGPPIRGGHGQVDVGVAS